MAVKQQFQSFEAVLNGTDQTLLVDFYATWCGPCQLMASILEQVQARLKGQLKIVKIDTDRYANLASRYGVYALPTLVVFKQGKEVHRIEGALQADDLVNRLTPFL